MYGSDELHGSLISLEFNRTGRVTSIWASDPQLPEEGQEFQFALPPIQFGDENAQDYFLGTVLLGARYDPDDPWALGRTSKATFTFDPFDSDDEDEDDEMPFPTPDARRVEIAYEFSMFEELTAKGTWYEIPGAFPQVVWDLEITNTARRSVEIGELGFPVALNTLLDGFGWTDEDLSKLWDSRCAVHKFIGGAASWMLAKRLNGKGPDLLVYPGEGTSWEFYSHVPSSLRTPLQWEGLPVVYALSRATVEREDWSSWMNEHTSIVLGPGDSKRFQLRMTPVESDRPFALATVLANCDRPVISALDGCVMPAGVGASIELAGSQAKRVLTSRDVSVQIETGERQSTVKVDSAEAGPVAVILEDDAGRISRAHINLIEPIGDLIQARRDFIVKNQVVSRGPTVLKHCIAPYDQAEGRALLDQTTWHDSAGLDGSLADALFLAAACTVYPDKNGIKALDDYISGFLERHIRRTDGAVASQVSLDREIAFGFGRPLNYVAVALLYLQRDEIARRYGSARDRSELLQKAWATAIAMFRRCAWHYLGTIGIALVPELSKLVSALAKDGQQEHAHELDSLLNQRERTLARHRTPFAGESALDTAGLADVAFAAAHQRRPQEWQRACSAAFAMRSLAPSWWWFGSEKRIYDGSDAYPASYIGDRGELCLSFPTATNAQLWLRELDQEYLWIAEDGPQRSYAGLIGQWALVRSDGAASMAFCPDSASSHAGFVPVSGSIGYGLYSYIVNIASYFAPRQAGPPLALGMTIIASDESMRIVPFDGVGQRVVLRKFDLEFTVETGRIEEIYLDNRLRSFKIVVANHNDRNISSLVQIKGLRPDLVQIAGKKVARDALGAHSVRIDIPAGLQAEIEGKVV